MHAAALKLCARSHRVYQVSSSELNRRLREIWKINPGSYHSSQSPVSRPAWLLGCLRTTFPALHAAQHQSVQGASLKHSRTSAMCQNSPNRIQQVYGIISGKAPLNTGLQEAARHLDGIAPVEASLHLVLAGSGAEVKIRPQKRYC